MKRNILYKFSMFLAAFFSIFYIETLFRTIMKLRLEKFIGTFFILLTIFIPFILSRLAKNKGIHLSPIFNIIFLSFIFASSYLGTILDFYIVFPWWDILLHTSAGIIFTILGVYLINILINLKVIGYIKNKFLISSIALCFSVTVNTLWEAFEYISDMTLRTNMTNLSLKDTMEDMIACIIGAIIASIVYGFLFRKKEVS